MQKKEDFVYSHFQSQHIFNYAIVFPSGCMLVSIQKAVTSGSKGVLLAMGKVLGWKRLVQLNKDLLKTSASLSQLSCTFEWLNLVEILYKRASRGSHLLDHLWRKGGRELPYSTTCFCWFGVKNSRAKVKSCPNVHLHSEQLEPCAHIAQTVQEALRLRQWCACFKLCPDLRTSKKNAPACLHDAFYGGTFNHKCRSWDEEELVMRCAKY